ncbi:MAG: protein kinase [Nannocystis sp.]|uniref:serine/threonine-protein kinase n=1 Tax=Nannocystis sp. TaxID=1962667 RepID=UPI00242655BB|nr:serine/threonine-protein kinase [Nannocystis sp.]MBK9756832.1 protein kinase [Nannocystis sp.]
MPALPPPVSLAPALAPCRSCGRVYPADRLQCPQDGALLPLEGRLLDNKFRLDRKIGDGGMASVWQATNTFVHRSVALKLMHARFASDAELLGRFRNEASAAGRIGSPHICDVLDFGTSEIGPYIVLELLEGASLAELIQTHRRLDPGLAVWIVRQALTGLAAAHKAGIVHRDLKPENIYLCRAIRGQWVVKLMDFGISKFAHHFLTAAGATMGTPHYMAPEQLQGASRVDARADLWSIGVILYEAITGVQLFARQNVADALVALRSYQPPPLSQYLPTAPRGLAEVITRCLQREPKNRYASAEALLADLAPFERAGPAELKRAAGAGPKDMSAAGAVKTTGAQAAVKAAVTAAVKTTGAQAVVKPVASAGVAKPAGPQAVKTTGAQAVVKPGAPAGVVKPAGPMAVKTTGAQAVVKPGAPVAAPAAKPVAVAAKSGAPGAVRPTVAQPAVARPTGPGAARPGPVGAGAKPSQALDSLPTRPMQRPAAAGPAARARPPAQWYMQTWLWGLALGLLGGLLVLLAALTR